MIVESHYLFNVVILVFPHKYQLFNSQVRHQTKILCIGDEFTEFCIVHDNATLVTTADAWNGRFNKKKYKKLGNFHFFFSLFSHSKAKAHDVAITSEHLIRQIPRMFGPVLNKVNRFPMLVEVNKLESVSNHMLNKVVPMLERTVRMRMGRHNCIYVPIGTVTLKPKQVAENLVTVLSQFALCLNKGYIHKNGGKVIVGGNNMEKLC